MSESPHIFHAVQKRAAKEQMTTIRPRNNLELSQLTPAYNLKTLSLTDGREHLKHKVVVQAFSSALGPPLRGSRLPRTSSDLLGAARHLLDPSERPRNYSQHQVRQQANFTHRFDRDFDFSQQPSLNERV